MISKEAGRMDDRRIHSEQADLLMKAVLTLETV